LKNAGILRNSTRAETSAEMTFREQLAGEQESTSELVELVDELKVRVEKARRELEDSSNSNGKSTIGSVS
jgi:hypothetical protein